jgi:hypothetical protein
MSFIRLCSLYRWWFEQLCDHEWWYATVERREEPMGMQEGIAAEQTCGRGSSASVSPPRLL